jgi:hypothetical protein
MFRFLIAMDDAPAVRGFESFGDLSGDRQRLVDRNRSAGDALRRILAALADMRDDVVDAEPGSGGEGHVVGIIRALRTQH